MKGREEHKDVFAGHSGLRKKFVDLMGAQYGLAPGPNGRIDQWRIGEDDTENWKEAFAELVRLPFVSGGKVKFPAGIVTQFIAEACIEREENEKKSKDVKAEKKEVVQAEKLVLKDPFIKAKYNEILNYIFTMVDIIEEVFVKELKKNPKINIDKIFEIVQTKLLEKQAELELKQEPSLIPKDPTLDSSIVNKIFERLFLVHLEQKANITLDSMSYQQRYKVYRRLVQLEQVLENPHAFNILKDRKDFVRILGNLKNKMKNRQKYPLSPEDRILLENAIKVYEECILSWKKVETFVELKVAENKKISPNQKNSKLLNSIYKKGYIAGHDAAEAKIILNKIKNLKSPDHLVTVESKKAREQKDLKEKTEHRLKMISSVQDEVSKHYKSNPLIFVYGYTVGWNEAEQKEDVLKPRNSRDTRYDRVPFAKPSALAMFAESKGSSPKKSRPSPSPRSKQSLHVKTGSVSVSGSQQIQTPKPHENTSRTPKNDEITSSGNPSPKRDGSSTKSSARRGSVKMFLPPSPEKSTGGSPKKGAGTPPKAALPPTTGGTPSKNTIPPLDLAAPPPTPKKTPT